MSDEELYDDIMVNMKELTSIEMKDDLMLSDDDDDDTYLDNQTDDTNPIEGFLCIEDREQCLPTCTFDEEGPYDVDLRPFRSIFSYYGRDKVDIEVDALPLLQQLLPLLRGTTVLVSLTDIDTLNRFYDLCNAYRKFCYQFNHIQFNAALCIAHQRILATARLNDKTPDDELRRYLGVGDTCYHAIVLSYPGRPELVEAVHSGLKIKYVC